MRSGSRASTGTLTSAGCLPPTDNGFTITELLVAVAVGAIASVLMVTAFVYTYGDVVAEQVKTQMVQQSQIFLRKMSDDIRVAQEIRTSNLLEDPSNSGGWTTSDPANILVTTQPATDENNDFVYDVTTGLPYMHEIVYFGEDGSLFKRLITNNGATGHKQINTCKKNGPNVCPPDIQLVENLDELLFTFYDVDDDVTTTPEEARSVQITVNLEKQVYGRILTATHTTRMNLRNAN